MDIQEQTLTIEAFWELSQQPEYADLQCELVEGKLVVMSPSSGRNSWIAMTIGMYLNRFVIEHNLGRVTGADGGFKLSHDSLRAPDVGFISNERLPDDDFTFIPVAPDLAVEVISPSETAHDAQQKTRAYLDAGSRMVWNVYPDNRVVEVVTRLEDGKLLTDTLSQADTLTGGELLPGFELNVALIFA